MTLDSASKHPALFHESPGLYLVLALQLSHHLPMYVYGLFRFHACLRTHFRFSATGVEEPQYLKLDTPYRMHAKPALVVFPTAATANSNAL